MSKVTVTKQFYKKINKISTLFNHCLRKGMSQCYQIF